MQRRGGGEDGRRRRFAMCCERGKSECEEETTRMKENNAPCCFGGKVESRSLPSLRPLETLVRLVLPPTPSNSIFPSSRLPRSLRISGNDSPSRSVSSSSSSDSSALLSPLETEYLLPVPRSPSSRPSARRLPSFTALHNRSASAGFCASATCRSADEGGLGVTVGGRSVE